MTVKQKSKRVLSIFFALLLCLMILGIFKMRNDVVATILMVSMAVCLLAAAGLRCSKCGKKISPSFTYGQRNLLLFYGLSSTVVTCKFCKSEIV
jgi:hypothetical protein